MIFISTVYATIISFHITISSEQHDDHNYKTLSATGCSYQYSWQLSILVHAGEHGTIEVISGSPQ